MANKNIENKLSELADVLGIDELEKNNAITKAWYVGATGNDENNIYTDFSSKFIEESRWENLSDTKFLNDVNSIKEGDLIALKSSYTRKNNLPFNNNDKTVGVMAIKAIGVVTNNPHDGKNIGVEWEKVEPIKEWFGKGIIMQTISLVESSSGLSKELLLQFTFNNKAQDYSLVEEQYKDETETEQKNKLLVDSSLENEIIRRWNEKDFRYIENIEDIYKDFQSKFGKEALIHMSDEDCLNKLFGMKDEQGLFYYLQYKYGYFSGIGTLYGGTQRKIYKTIESGDWHVRKDGTKKINVVEIEEAKKEAVEYRNKYVELFEKIENLINKNKLSTKEDYQALATEINNNYKDFNSNWGHKYLHLLFPEYFMPFYNDWWINTTFSIIGEDILKKYGKEPSKHYYELCQEFCSLAKSLKIRVIYLYHILLAIDGIEDDEYDEEKINLKEKYREWLGNQLKEDGKPYAKGYINNLVTKLDTSYKGFHMVAGIESLYEIEDLKTYCNAYDEIVNYPGFKEFNNKEASTNTYSATLNLYKKFLIEYFKVGNNVIYYGIPGCGKSYYVEHNILKNVKEKNKYRTTFYLDYSNSDFIGQIYPTVTKEKDTAGNLVSRVKYTKIPGPFTKALERAYRHPEKNIYLVIEEINRGNAAAIFGDLFQLLDRLKDDSKCDDGRVSGDSEYPINNEFIEGYLEDKGVEIPGMDKIYIPHNMFILATMNTSDQNVFPLDTAFKRRWQRERITSDWKDVDERKEMLVPGTHTKWKDFVEKVNAAIVTPTENGILSEDKQIGAFFVSKENLVEEENYFDMSTSNFVEQQKIKSFLNNVIDYLYNDVTKFDHKQLFNEELKSFEQLYKRVIDEHDTTYGLKCLEE